MTVAIPSDWREVELRALITELSAGVSVNSEDRPIRAGEVGVLKTSCVTTGTFDPSQHKAVVDKDVKRVATPVQRDRIIMSRMNTAALVGASAYVERDTPRLYLPDRLWQFGGHQGAADSRWLSYLMASQEVRRVLSSMATGTSGSMKNLTKEQVRSLEVLLPPLDEQRQIAATLKAVDGATAAGEAVIEQVNRTRRALIEILVGHPQHSSARVTDVGTVSYGLTVDGERRKALNVSPYLTVANVGAEGDFDLTTVKEIGTLGNDARYVLEPGDVLVIEGNANLNRIGVAAIWRGALGGVLHQNHLMRVRPDPTKVDPDWLCYALATRRCREQIEGSAKTTSGLHTINSSVLGGLRIPLPALAEQRSAVARLVAVEGRLRAEREVVAQRRRLKAALAAALLTGKIRVPSQDVA